MNTNKLLEIIIPAISTALHQVDIEPHGHFTERQIRYAIECKLGPCRLCGCLMFSPEHRADNMRSHEFEPIV